MSSGLSIDTICSGCSKRLRVGQEHAGKQARCPQCQTIYIVPDSAAPSRAEHFASLPGRAPLADRWQLKTGDGLTYGPVSKAELDRWLAEGRVTPQSQVLQEGAGQWQWSGQVYPQLAAATGVKENPFAELPLPLGEGRGEDLHPGEGHPYAPAYPGPSLYNPTTHQYMQPHRGPLILTMAIVGIFSTCGLLAIVSLVFAIIDLGEMRRGRMDPSGRGITIAGLIVSALPLAAIAAYILFIMVAVVAGILA